MTLKNTPVPFDLVGWGSILKRFTYLYFHIQLVWSYIKQNDKMPNSLNFKHEIKGPVRFAGVRWTIRFCCQACTLQTMSALWSFILEFQHLKRKHWNAKSLEHIGQAEAGEKWKLYHSVRNVCILNWWFASEFYLSGNISIILYWMKTLNLPTYTYKER